MTAGDCARDAVCNGQGICATALAVGAACTATGNAFYPAFAVIPATD